MTSMKRKVWTTQEKNALFKAYQNFYIDKNYFNYHNDTKRKFVQSYKNETGQHRSIRAIASQLTQLISQRQFSPALLRVDKIFKNKQQEKMAQKIRSSWSRNNYESLKEWINNQIQGQKKNYRTFAKSLGKKDVEVLFLVRWMSALGEPLYIKEECNIMETPKSIKEVMKGLKEGNCYESRKLPGSYDSPLEGKSQKVTQNKEPRKSKKTQASNMPSNKNQGLLVPKKELVVQEKSTFLKEKTALEEKISFSKPSVDNKRKREQSQSISILSKNEKKKKRIRSKKSKMFQNRERETWSLDEIAHIGYLAKVKECLSSARLSSLSKRYDTTEKSILLLFNRMKQQERPASCKSSVNDRKLEWDCVKLETLQDIWNEGSMSVLKIARLFQVTEDEIFSKLRTLDYEKGVHTRSKAMDPT